VQEAARAVTGRSRVSATHDRPAQRVACEVVCTRWRAAKQLTEDGTAASTPVPKIGVPAVVHRACRHGELRANAIVQVHASAKVLLAVEVLDRTRVKGLRCTREIPD